MQNDTFHTTQWTAVLAARGNDTAGREALGDLCQRYYGPVERFVQRVTAGSDARRYGGRDAKDLTHVFFARVLEGEMFTELQRNGGAFRAYLRGAVRHFLAKTREREAAEKRGGGVAQIPLAEDLAVFSETDADAFFDCQWAHAMIDAAVLDLGNSPETQRLLPWLTQEMSAQTRTALAEEFGMTDVALRVALHRLRKRFRAAVRTWIAATVAHESEIDGELVYLIRALRK